MKSIIYKIEWKKQKNSAERFILPSCISGTAQYQLCLANWSLLQAF
jgi:hypothetical protein